jgi:hypothetical protein
MRLGTAQFAHAHDLRRLYHRPGRPACEREDLLAIAASEKTPADVPERYQFRVFWSGG